jgi:two-component system chemotaxis response regulator CheB
MPNLRPDMGVAFVIVNHMRTVATQLHKVISFYTTMPVELIKERLIIQPNCIFVIPSNQDLYILNGKFHLKPLSKSHRWPDVITVFLRSLKNSWDGKLIAIIVSGCDSDGADALCDINEV